MNWIGSRNAICSCGSGKRFKHCCGGENPGSPPTAALDNLMNAALAHQRRGDHVAAEALYRQALAIRPDEPDCLHMLGVICLETGRSDEAFETVYRALSLTQWRIDAMRHNMGLILARRLADADATRDTQRQYTEHCRLRDVNRIDANPLVTVVVPSYNHSRWIQQALDSVYAQTYRRLELIVIDDGSTDGSAAVIREHLANCPFPCRFIARENRGAAVTINEGVALARGEYINVLNSDDRFTDTRISTMVEGIACRAAEWGFGEITFVDAVGAEINPLEDRRVFALIGRMNSRSALETLGAAFLDFNHAISTGNLFFRKSFFEHLGRFRDYRYNHDWDFCLRATLASEPIFVPRNTYAYRLHDHNTITESKSGQGPRKEASEILSDYFASATQGPAPSNRFAPTIHAWGAKFFHWIMQSGSADLLPVEILLKSAEAVRNGALGDIPGITLEPERQKAEISPEDAPLPDDFDPSVYLKLNPDVSAAGIDAAEHYLEWGRQEGRHYKLIATNVHDDVVYDPRRETILVVSHEASRTGAPILSLNLVQELIERYNVVVLLLGGGPLSNAFKRAGAAVVASSHLRDNQAMADHTIDKLCETFEFKFALVNSIESRIVLPRLGKHFIPTVCLIHEFAAYTRPRQTFTDAIFWSTRIVFSTHLTRDNALAEYGHLGDWMADSIPQGRCLIPPDDHSEPELQAERERVRRAVRPESSPDDLVVVLGAGFVQFRKGVDLFIDCAARVSRHPEGERFRFIWIGGGFDPERDARYSVYLEDQLSRADLKNRVFLLDETSAIDAAYAAADILLLSSRLDPLPNVAIDAMANGLPVLCFDKTTGIADILAENDLKTDCVAPYLDTADMANKLLAMAASPALRTRAGEQCRAIVKTCFDMRNYASRLANLATDRGERSQLERADVQTIVDSGLFRGDFACPLHVQGQTVEDKVRFYVRGWASGVMRRKPMPGFHPGIYLEQHGVSANDADPFADYLRAGRPGGPWSYPVIVPGDTDENFLPERRRVALHVHAYWPELLPEIVSRLSRNRVRPDLFISVSDDAPRALVTDSLGNYAGDIAAVSVVPNRGRDIGPFLTEFGRAMMSGYDFVGHVHTKKSTDIADSAMGTTWFRFMLENLVGGQSGAAADSILSHMSRDSSLGMVFPDDPHIVQWGKNRAIAEPLAQKMGLGGLPEHFIFPVGTMFWARSSALRRLMDLELDWTDYPAEPTPYDGTLLHAIERLFSLAVYAGGFRCAAANVAGLTR